MSKIKPLSLLPHMLPTSFYERVESTKKCERIEPYDQKSVENIVLSVSHDIHCNAKKLSGTVSASDSSMMNCSSKAAPTLT